MLPVLPFLLLSDWLKWARWKHWFPLESWKKMGRQEGQETVKTQVSEVIYIQVNFLSLIKQIRIKTTSLSWKLCNWIKLQGSVLQPFSQCSSIAAVALMQRFLQPGKLFSENLLRNTFVSASKHDCKILCINIKMFSVLPALQSVK